MVSPVGSDAVGVWVPVPEGATGLPAPPTAAAPHQHNQHHERSR